MGGCLAASTDWFKSEFLERTSRTERLDVDNPIFRVQTVRVQRSIRLRHFMCAVFFRWHSSHLSSRWLAPLLVNRIDGRQNCWSQSAAVPQRDSMSKVTMRMHPMRTVELIGLQGFEFYIPMHVYIDSIHILHRHEPPAVAPPPPIPELAQSKVFVSNESWVMLYMFAIFP